MLDDIKKVYVGLPDRLKDLVKWVAREFRRNPLSFEPGGADVIVEYHSGKVLGYDWIKFPSHYIAAIFKKGILNEYGNYENMHEREQLSLIRKEIRRLFARKYTRDTYTTEPFEEVWNSESSKQLPWETLEDFDADKNKKTQLPAPSVPENPFYLPPPLDDLPF